MTMHARPAGYVRFRAHAADLDGTLAVTGRPSGEVLAVLARARADGCRMLLVTGRIVAELLGVFADVHEHFDRIVAEDGAVLADRSLSRPLAPRVDEELYRALRTAGASFRRGEVILAGGAEDERLAVEEIRRLGLDHRLVRNRGALMIVPAGITKGRGVIEALADLGVSRHNAIAVGDAENDLSLVRACGLGIAVANAVESLKREADWVLSAENGAGVAELLGGAIFSGERVLDPPRWRVTVGHDRHGAPVQIPSFALNVLVSGPTGSGKSYVAGLLAEQLIRAAYTVLVVDPEGDYEDLRALPGVATMGDDGVLPDPRQVVAMLHHRFGSVVVDLCRHDAGERQAFAERAAPTIHAHRIATGLPHWVLVDEAHGPFADRGLLRHIAQPEAKGFIFVTYHPELLPADVLAEVDVEIILPGASASAVFPVAEPPMFDQLARAGRGHAIVITSGTVSLVTLAARQTPHVRHQHKYVAGRLPTAKRFYFQAGPGAPSDASAANLIELHRELARCHEAVLRHHVAGHDFSRWIREVFQDSALGHTFATIEDQLLDASDGCGDAELARHAFLEAIRSHYLE